MPVTIPPFTNVPAPNDPVASAWAQQLTQFAVDQIVAQPGTPASPNTELWYDTDDAGASFPNMPRGYVAHAVASAGQTVTTTGAVVDFTGCSVTFTADPTRRYRISLLVPRLAQSSTATEQRCAIRDAANNVMVWDTQGVPANQAFHHNVWFLASGLSGAQTYKGGAQLFGGTADTTVGFLPIILVEDIGSAGQSGGGIIGPWTAYTPTLTQPGAITKNVTSATYTVNGKLVVCQINLAVTGAGTGGSPILATLPIAPRNNNAVLGIGQFYDASAGTRYVCVAVGSGAGAVALAVNGASTDLLGISPNLALASGDGFSVNVSYEAS